MKKYIVIIFLIIFLLLNSINIIAEANLEELNFDVIKAKKIDLDLNIVIPVSFENYNSNNNFIFKTPVFYDTSFQKIVSSEYYYFDSKGEKHFAEIEKDEFGNLIAVFEISSIDKNYYEFIIFANIISENKFLLTNNIYSLENDINEFIEYKEPSLNIQSDRGEIISLSKQISKSNNAFKELVEYTNWVHQNITYNIKYSEKTYESIKVLEEMEGVCDEFSVLAASLLRARGFPVRYVSGYSNSTYEWQAHAWLEVYIPNQGWIPVDPTYGEVGLVDASHILLNVSKDSLDIKDKVTTANNVSVNFHERIFDFKINSQNNFQDLGFSNVLDLDIISEKTMKEKSAFEIKAFIKNTSINPLITLIQINTHNQFQLIYPKENNLIIYLDPFEEKELSFFYILPEVSFPMYYNFIVSTQLKDENSFVEIYKDKGIFREAFFVYDPLFHFKDGFLQIDIDTFNYTDVNKNIDINFFYNNKENIENITIYSGESKKIIKTISEDINSLFLEITRDYDYLNTIKIFKNEIILDNKLNIDVNNSLNNIIDTEEEYVDIWQEVVKDYSKDVSYFKIFMYVLSLIFICLLILFITSYKNNS
ncbi:MAG: transglutaminase family protein [Candidatus ainarchaeum sp.]|nr:transglutaminase family protein [Candidatus ainarchaeum sp.]MDD3976169.1 transglutaminase family protein [Candidatus ainarchaeum sp.]